MARHLSACFVLMLSLLVSIKCNEICNVSDVGCWTKDANPFFETVIKGGNNLFEPLEPLHVQDFNKTERDLSLQVSNATFTGLLSCKTTYLRLFSDVYKYEYHLQCNLNLTVTIVAKGYLGNVYIDGKDTVTIIANDYVIKFKGCYKTFDTENFASRFNSCEDFTMDTEPKKMPSLTTKNMFGIPKSQVPGLINYCKRYWKAMEKEYRYPIMKEFMTQIVQAGHIFLLYNDIDAIFPKNKTSSHH